MSDYVRALREELAAQQQAGDAARVADIEAELARVDAGAMRAAAGDSGEPKLRRSRPRRTTAG